VYLTHSSRLGVEEVGDAPLLVEWRQKCWDFSKLFER